MKVTEFVKRFGDDDFGPITPSLSSSFGNMTRHGRIGICPAQP
jgi:hypothetical protein